MANGDRARRWLVRTALVTSSTVATLIGAQTLVAIDQPASEEQIQPASQTALPEAAPSSVIIHAAPSIVIMRQSGNVPNVAQAPSVTPTQIMPPPQPRIIQQPVRPVSRSTR